MKETESFKVTGREINQFRDEGFDAGFTEGQRNIDFYMLGFGLVVGVGATLLVQWLL